MTAGEWDASDDLWLMIHNAEQRTGDQRKLSLFGVGCCRRHWASLPAESRAVLAEFEAILDRLTNPTPADLCQAGRSLCARANEAVRSVSPQDVPGLAAAKAVCYAVVGSAWGAKGYFEERDPAEKQHHLDLLREVFGNPFRPVALPRNALPPEVIGLGQAVYVDRVPPAGELDPARLAVLADALEDAGCIIDAEVTSHLRAPGPHYRGCWALDLVLGKE
jgi:hypothetical protein